MNAHRLSKYVIKAFYVIFESNASVIFDPVSNIFSFRFSNILHLKTSKRNNLLTRKIKIALKSFQKVI